MIVESLAVLFVTFLNLNFSVLTVHVFVSIMTLRVTILNERVLVQF